MGKIEQDIAKQAIRSREPLPDRIANAPELQQGLEFYLCAFFDLDTDRHHGMGLMAIKWSSINDYAKAYELDEEQTEDLFYFIRKIDEAHLKRLDKKPAKNA